jgi:hypothetical protein
VDQIILQQALSSCIADAGPLVQCSEQLSGSNGRARFTVSRMLQAERAMQQMDSSSWAWLFAATHSLFAWKQLQC